MAAPTPAPTPSATPTNFGIPPGLVSAGAASSVPSTRRIDTTPPLHGGGDLSADRVLSVTLPAFPFGIFEAEDGEDGMAIPGRDGLPGEAGADGRPGQTILLEPDEPEFPMLIPGRDGVAGAAGSTGSAGRDGVTIFLEPDDPE